MPVPERAPESFFTDHPDALTMYRIVSSRLEDLGPFEAQTTKPQAALRRRRRLTEAWLRAE